MPRPLFELGERLQACADFVRPGSRVADIGSDHALLPIWLLKTGRASSAIASDIARGPLAAAMLNASKYAIDSHLDIRLSAGLENYSVGEAEDIIIAGMGGEMILKIISDASWLKNTDINLILQPMSMSDCLRCGLIEQGFDIVKERAVVENGKAYSIMLVSFLGERRVIPEIWKYMGEIQPGYAGANSYALKVYKDLMKRAAGQPELAEVAEEIKKYFRIGE